MITEDRIRVLFAEANPVPDEATLVLDEREVIAYLANLEQRSSEVPQQSSRTNQPSRYRGPAWAVAAFVAVLAVAALYLAFADDTDQVADNPPPPTVAPDIETMTDLELVEAGVAALYSGDAEHAVQLFELQDGDDDQIRQEAAYQAAIGGRLTLDCTELNPSGVFACNVLYHNGVTDAVGYVDSPGDTNRVVVQDGMISEFALPEHGFLLNELGNFLREQVEGHEGCVDDLTVPNGRFLLRTPECARLIMNHLDEWADWCGQIVQPHRLFAKGCERE